MRTTRQRKYWSLVAAMLIVACGDDAMHMVGDAAIDAGELLHDAASGADAADLDATLLDAAGVDGSAPPRAVFTASCEMSSDGTSSVAEWTIPGLNPDTVRVIQVRLCNPTGTFGPPEARAQECAVAGFGAYAGTDTLVVPCFLYAEAEVELEL